MGNAITGEVIGSNFYSQELKNVLGFDVDNQSTCKSCEFRYLCGGGCRARSYCSVGKADGVDSYCAFLKSYYDHSMTRLLNNDQQRI